MSESPDRGDPFTVPAGPRVTDDRTILDYQAGRDPENPAIPFADIRGRETVADWRALIETETAREDPRPEVIGYANRNIQYLEQQAADDNEDGGDDE